MIRRGYASADLFPGRTISHRLSQIVELLEWRRDVWQQARLDSASGGAPDSRPLFLDPACTRSFHELDRCLTVLRERMPKKYRNLAALFDAPTKPVAMKARRVRGMTVVEDENRRMVVYQPPSWVRLDEVRSGCEHLEGLFRGEPFLPRELTLPPAKKRNSEREAA